MKPARVLRAALISVCCGCASAPAPEASDTPHPSQVVVLEYIDCGAAQAALRELNKGLEPGSRIVALADEASNSLLLSGPPEVMARAKDLIAMLDTPTR